MEQLCFTGESACSEWRPNPFRQTKCGNCGRTLNEHSPHACIGITEDTISTYLDIVAGLEPCSLVIARTEDSDWGALYIGSKDGLRRSLIEKNQIEAVAQTAKGLEDFFPALGREIGVMEEEGTLKVFRAQWVDSSDQQLMASDMLLRAIDFIHAHRRQGKNVLVSCAAGKSRSGSLVIAYLMAIQGKLPAGGQRGELPSSRLDAARFYKATLKLVQTKRAIVEPNQSFQEELTDFSYGPALREIRERLF